MYLTAWNAAPTTFANLYFVELLENFWTPKTLPNGNVQYKDPNDTIMMLPSDMVGLGLYLRLVNPQHGTDHSDHYLPFQALLNDAEFKKWVVLYARDQDKFFQDFAKAFAKLLELGVTRGGNKSWFSSLFGSF